MENKKCGRPPKPEHLKRTRAFHMRVTQHNFDVIRGFAKDAGMSVTDYLLRAAQYYWDGEGWTRENY